MTPPPLPPLNRAVRQIITTTGGLEVGDVLFIAKKIQPRGGGDEYWWKAFWVVTDLSPHWRRQVEVLLLKMRPDMDKDQRTFQMNEPDLVIEYMPEHTWTQGTIAIRTKLLMQGIVKL